MCIRRSIVTLVDPYDPEHFDWSSVPRPMTGRQFRKYCKEHYKHAEVVQRCNVESSVNSDCKCVRLRMFWNKILKRRK